MPDNRNNILLEAKDIKKIYGKVIQTVALKGLNFKMKKVQQIVGLFFID